MKFSGVAKNDTEITKIHSTWFFEGRVLWNGLWHICHTRTDRGTVYNTLKYMRFVLFTWYFIGIFGWKTENYGKQTKTMYENEKKMYEKGENESVSFSVVWYWPNTWHQGPHRSSCTRFFAPICIMRQHNDAASHKVKLDDLCDHNAIPPRPYRPSPIA